MTTSAAVRQKLVEALSLDLVGPDATADDHYQDEIISQAPSKWYLTGFLVPYEASVQDRSGDTADEGLELDAPTSRSSEDENTPETASARKALFPSSIGLSFLISSQTTSLDLEVYWGDYQPIKPDGTVENKTKTDRWQRQRQLQRLTVQISDSTQPVTLDVPHSDGLKLAISNRPVNGTTKLPAGTRAISIFLVNHFRAETAAELLRCATIVNQRIAAGLQALDDPDVLTAFRMANRSISTAIRQRGIHNSDRSPADTRPPTWRPFQLAFLLMNLVGIAQPTTIDSPKGEASPTGNRRFTLLPHRWR